MKFNRVWIVGALCWGVLSAGGALAANLQIKAARGEVKEEAFGQVMDKGELHATLRLTAFTGSDAWPATAGVGLRYGPDGRSGVHVVALRQREDDKQLTLGYRIMDNGQQIRFQTLGKAPLNSSQQVLLFFKRGQLHVRLNEGQAQAIQSPLVQGQPFVLVSSGSAEFTVDD